jgi:hypothetical protein
MKSVNKTLNDVSKKELILEEIRDIKNFVNEENGESEQKYTYISMLLMLNGHAIQLQRTSEVRDEYDIIIQSSMIAKGGIIQPQVLSPSRMIHILKSSEDSSPRELQVPVPVSNAYAYFTS